MSLTISACTIGKRKPLFGDFVIPPPEDLHDDGSLRLRDLIEHIVRQQVEAFNQRKAEQRFDRVLTSHKIEESARTGKVSPEGRSPGKTPDPDEAVAEALQAFEDGLYLVVIDEVERRVLDEPVYLASNSRILFVRLTFLAGA